MPATASALIRHQESFPKTLPTLHLTADSREERSVAEEEGELRESESERESERDEEIGRNRQGKRGVKTGKQAKREVLSLSKGLFMLVRAPCQVLALA